MLALRCHCCEPSRRESALAWKPRGCRQSSAVLRLASAVERQGVGAQAPCCTGTAACLGRVLAVIRLLQSRDGACLPLPAEDDVDVLRACIVFLIISV